MQPTLPGVEETATESSGIVEVEAVDDVRRHTGSMRADPLDDALTVFAATAPEFGPLGLSNHGPMAAEVLGQLGHEDTISAWVKAYCARLDAGGPGGGPRQTASASAPGDGAPSSSP